MTKLITVTVSFDYLIVVEDGQDKYKVAESHCSEAFKDISISDMDYTFSSYPKTKPYAWDDACLPYGSDGRTTKGYMEVPE